MIHYNFAEGPDHYKALNLWQTIKKIVSYNSVSRVDKVLFALRRGLITEAEANLVTAWLSIFQIEDFAQ